MRIPISAVVIAKNEEKQIAGCIKALKFCREIVVIDDYSSDNTVIICQKLGAKVYKRHLNNDFAAQRNWALKKVKNEWVLFVDADEIVSKRLADEIMDRVGKEDFNGYKVLRVDYFWGKRLTHGEFGKVGKYGNANILRLGKKNKGKWIRSVHEVWKVAGSVSEIRNELLHYSHQTLFGFLTDIGVRAKIHSMELIKEEKRVNIGKVVIWPVGKFIRNEILKFGFLDEVEGFVVNVLMSFHSFLAWSNLWLLKNSKR